jgi:hypothetical protein
MGVAASVTLLFKEEISSISTRSMIPPASAP